MLLNITILGAVLALLIPSCCHANSTNREEVKDLLLVHHVPVPVGRLLPVAVTADFKPVGRHLLLSEGVSAVLSGLLSTARGKSFSEALHVSLQASSQALVNGTAQGQALEAEATAGISTMAGVLAVLITIGCAWGLEAILQRMWPVQAPSLTEPGPYLPALGFARYLAALHVLLSNFAGPTLGASGLLARWGVLQAPFFFVLGGFCSSYWKLIGPARDEYEDSVAPMLRKLLRWYPLYAIGLTFCAVDKWSFDAEDWSQYTAGMLLINGFVWSADMYPHFHGSWWISYFFFYLLMWSTVHGILSDTLRNRATDSVVCTIFIVSTLLGLPFAFFEWFVAEGFAPFYMIQYWPSFIFGQALAFWFVRHCMFSEDDGDAEPGSSTVVVANANRVFKIKHTIMLPFWTTYGATFFYLVVGVLMFTCAPDDHVPFIGKPASPLVLKGCFLPLLGVLVVGLACGADPLAKLFARLPWTGDLAFATWTLQVPVRSAVRRFTGNDFEGISCAFLLTLLGTSFVAHHVVERPWREGLGVGKRRKDIE